MASTYEEIMAKSRELYAGGDLEGAKRLARIALSRRGNSSSDAPVQKNPDGTYGQIPEGMVLNPATGQYTSRELLANNMAPGAAASALTGGGQGATFGAADEMAGGLNAVLPGNGTMGERYAFGREYSRAMVDAARRDHPVAAYGGEIAAAASTAMATPIGKIGSGGPSLARNVVAGAGGGAGVGALTAFLSGEGGLKDRAGSVPIGAILGAAGGAAAPVLGGLAQKGWRAGAEAVGRFRLGSQAGESLNIDPRAARIVSDMLGMEDPAAAKAAVAKGGASAMLADAGPTLSGSLDAAIQSPGRGARIAVGRVNDRAAGALGNITQALDETMGTATGVNTARAAVRGETAAARKAAYDAAYSQPINYADAAGVALEGLQSRLPGEAISYANKLMRTAGDKSKQIMATIGDDGSVTFKEMPDVRQWDYIKQALDHMAESGDGQGALGGQTRIGAAYKNLARDVRDGLKAAVPEYGAALETAADAISRSQGIKFGATVLRPGVTREEVAGAIKGATGPELAAVRQGVRSQIDEILANVRAVATDQNVDARQAQSALSNMSSPAAKEKLRMLLGAAWPKLEKQIDEASVALGLRANIATNSKTAARGAFNELLSGMEPGAIRMGRPVEAVKNAAATMLGASKSAVGRLKADTRADVADVLTRQGAAEIMKALERARANTTVSPQSGAALGQVVRALLMGGVATPTLQSQIGQLLLGRLAQ